MTEIDQIERRLDELERRISRSFLRRPSGAVEIPPIAGVIVTITQAGHGFAIGEVIYHDGLGWTYPLLGITTLPVSENAAHLEVVEVIDADTFKALVIGHAAYPSQLYSIIAVDAVGDSITVAGDQTRWVQAGQLIRVSGSSGIANGDYTATAVSLSGGNTVISVSENLTSSSASGSVLLGLGTRYLQRSDPPNGAIGSSAPQDQSPDWPNIAVGAGIAAEEALFIASNPPKSLLAVEVNGTMRTRGAPLATIERSISGVTYEGAAWANRWVLNDRSLTVSTAAQFRWATNAWLENDFFSTPLPVRGIVLRSDPVPVNSSDEKPNEAILTTSSSSGKYLEINMNVVDHLVLLESTGLRWGVFVGENPSGPTPVAQQSVSDPSTITITTATASATYNATARDMLNSLKTTFTDIHTTLDEIQTALEAYGLIG